ncbi:hypothetical protein BD414DRAFT_210966 [Trametes punicea]|nr:hypothetical protein BD414DRAFT_210966 [Trametes punicea]
MLSHPRIAFPLFLSLRRSALPERLPTFIGTPSALYNRRYRRARGKNEDIKIAANLGYTVGWRAVRVFISPPWVASGGRSSVGSPRAWRHSLNFNGVRDVSFHVSFLSGGFSCMLPHSVSISHSSIIATPV